MIKRNNIRLNKYKISNTTSNRRTKKRSLVYKVWHISADPHLRLKLLFLFMSCIFLLIFSRLFFLQVIKWEYYANEAFNQQYSKITIPARRWEIFASNSKTWELQKLATNISLDLIYIDPTNIPDKEKIAKELAPILFNEEDYKNCKENIKFCPNWNTIKFNENITLQEKPIDWWTWAILKDNRTMDELIRDYAEDILRKISKEYNDYVPLKYWANEKEMKEIKKLWISWLWVLEKSKVIYVNPLEINENNIENYSKRIVKIIPKYTEEQMNNLLKKRKVQYIPLKRKVSPEISEQIFALKLKHYKEHKKSPKEKRIDPETWKKKKVHIVPHFYKWVVLFKEHWRYYPEKTLAAPVIWYVDHEWKWNYWIEEFFNDEISWENWEVLNRKNIRWEFIFFDWKEKKDVKDWTSYVLTIDKIIQKKVEDVLKEWVEKYKADAGQIIVMDPNNWDILAMANYPTFDANNFWEVYKIVPIKEFVPYFWAPHDTKPQNEEEEWIKLYYTKPIFIKNKEWKFERFELDNAIEENKKIQEALTNSWIILERKQKYMYENGFWLRNYINHTIMSLYEPWSIFKPLVVAMALDANEIEPNTTYEEFWPIEIDTWTSQKQFIRTAEWVYRWIQTVTNAIEQSSNIWLAFVARKLWKQLFYEYLKDFNFWETYWIEQDWEERWRVTFWKKWNEAKQLTTSFWQWISVTPLQMAVSWSALANWWKLIQPKLIKEIIYPDWTKKIIETKVLKRVIDEKSSAQSTSILVSSVEHWVAKPWWVKWYKVAWKTWTAQMACTNSHRCVIWTYERKREWNFITAYWGYAPANNPKFVVLLKLDRPRNWPKTYWSNTTAPMHSEITKFLLEYYWIAPTVKTK